MTTTTEKLAEALRQCIACHEEPDCPALEVAREALAAWEAERAAPASHTPGVIEYAQIQNGIRATMAATPAAPAPARELSDAELDALMPKWLHEVELVVSVRTEVYGAMRAAIAAAGHAQKPLTREQIEKIMTNHYPLDSLLRENVDAFEACVRDIEAELGITGDSNAR